MFFSTKKEASITPHPSDLSTSFYGFIRADKNKHFSSDDMRGFDGVRSTNVNGGIGAGKTSAMKHIARQFLKMGMHGLVRTTKTDELELWIKLAMETGRKDDLIIIEANSPYTYNFLNQEAERSTHDGGGMIENVASLFLSVVSIANRMNGMGNTNGKEAFWILAMDRMQKATLELLNLAKKSAKMKLGSNGQDFDLSIINLSKILRDAPRAKGQLHKYENISSPKSMSQHQALQSWANRSYTIFCMTWAESYINALEDNLIEGFNAIEKLKISGSDYLETAQKEYEKSKRFFESEERKFEAAKSYFLSEFPNLAEKTRSSILEHFYAFSSSLRSGLLADMFSTTTHPDIIPENAIKNNKIIIINLPVLQFGNLGLVAQTIYAKCWRDAIKRRPVNSNTSCVFNWCDEAHFHITEDEIKFNTIARQYRVCNVFITQSISNYYAMLGGESAKSLVESLLGNMCVNLFFNNTSANNNEYASELIGRDYRKNITSSDTGASFSEEYQFRVLPKEFQTLKTGGRGKNKGIIEAILTITDKEFSNGKNYLKISFQQDL